MVTKLVFPKMILLNDYPARTPDLIKRNFVKHKGTSNTRLIISTEKRYV